MQISEQTLEQVAFMVPSFKQQLSFVQAEDEINNIIMEDVSIGIFSIDDVNKIGDERQTIGNIYYDRFDIDLPSIDMVKDTLLNMEVHVMK